MVIHITKDLMLASSVRAASAAAGRKYIQSDCLATIQEHYCQDAPILIIVDLQTPGITFAEFGRLPGLNSMVELVMYAQHVHEGLLADARSIPNAKVLTRGQFAQAVPRIIAKTSA